ncbi:hypothetical protein BEWA_035810 [Theileria equi strain WA]|uniref:Uncharacterized protein n=1 Tax=Theileria equi strain WA TaxID=1537102 RepID=L1LE68_THEEQ|nr:hypothetical protein BEWA_035810 [Theileria equi strain WA]EKX73545.1 hypothetical protein BEWA_035810 [Theileria equi strain WA]|eukprot:XP_004832997.1 hypothetical protein BEWA_035810 [Theileria equi strain WA]
MINGAIESISIDISKKPKEVCVERRTCPQYPQVVKVIPESSWYKKYAIIFPENTLGLDGKVTEYRTITHRGIKQMGLPEDLRGYKELNVYYRCYDKLNQMPIALEFIRRDEDPGGLYVETEEALFGVEGASAGLATSGNVPTICMQTNGTSSTPFQNGQTVNRRETLYVNCGFGSNTWEEQPKRPRLLKMYDLLIGNLVTFRNVVAVDLDVNGGNYSHFSIEGGPDFMLQTPTVFVKLCLTMLKGYIKCSHSFIEPFRILCTILNNSFVHFKESLMDDLYRQVNVYYESAPVSEPRIDVLEFVSLEGNRRYYRLDGGEWVPCEFTRKWINWGIDQTTGEDLQNEDQCQDVTETERKKQRIA